MILPIGDLTPLSSLAQIVPEFTQEEIDEANRLINQNSQTNYLPLLLGIGVVILLVAIALSFRRTRSKKKR